MIINHKPNTVAHTWKKINKRKTKGARQFSSPTACFHIRYSQGFCGAAESSQLEERSLRGSGSEAHIYITFIGFVSLGVDVCRSIQNTSGLDRAKQWQSSPSPVWTAPGTFCLIHLQSAPDGTHLKHIQPEQYLNMALQYKGVMFFLYTLLSTYI